MPTDDDIFGTPTNPAPGPQPDPQPETDNTNRPPTWEGTPGINEAALLTAAMVGRDTRTVTVLGHPVTMHTLTVGETLQATQAAKPYDDTRGTWLATKTALLAAAIDTIDGQPLATPARISDNMVALKYQTLLNDYHPAFIEACYPHYEALEKEQADLIEQLKKAPTP